MGVKLKNNVVGYISSAISASDIYITLQSGNGVNFPTLEAGDYFYATLVSASNILEIIKVTSRVGDILTVVRGEENTTPNSFAGGSRLEMRVTAKSVTDALSQLAIRSHYFPFAGTGSQLAFTLGTAPYDVYAVFVTVNGLILKYTSDYTISGTTLTFITAPALNDEIVVRWLYIQSDIVPEIDSQIYIVLG